MPLRKRAKSVTDGVPDPGVTGTSETLTLAEAEAAAAEAEAKAARARAQAIRLKQQSDAAPAAVEAGATPGAEGTAPDEDGEDDDADALTVETSSDSSDADGPVAAQPASEPRAFWRPLRWIAGTLAVLVIAGLVTVSVLMVLHHRQVQAQQQRAAEYIATGRQGVVTLMSLNFNSIDDDIQRILDNSTGEFKKDFEDKAKDFSQVARDSKVITEASTTAAGLESMTDSDAVVLVAARTKVTNSAGAVQEPRSWRLVIHLVREGDQIKMSKVDFAP